MASRTVTAHALPEGVARIQSPSSINTLKQCPRKYWYSYVARLPAKPSIHLVRGTIVHAVLERFFDTDVSNVPEEPQAFFFTMKVILNELFRREWEAQRHELEPLPLTPEELLGYYDETRRMVNNYFDYFTAKTGYFTRFLPMKEAWEAVKPARELEFVSATHHVRGFMDAIHDEHGKALILDYKTSRRAEVTPEYELQLSIYALLYQEKHRTPDRVGIFFLKEGREELREVTQEMIEQAKRAIHEMHLATRTIDIRDYPKRPGPLCRWATGQCDFYEFCWEGKGLPEKGKH
jgi:putative RecB family exonuclease